MRVVLFDFDGTLTRGDTLLPFLRFLVGAPRFWAGMAWLSPVLALYAAGVLRNDRAKAIVLRHFLRGRPLAQLQEAGERFAGQQLPALLRTDMMARVRAHVERGDVCVLVSASLDIYLAPWARGHGFDAVLCSRLAAQAGQVSGDLAGPNCFGPEKVARVQAWLREGGHTPLEVIAYGDSRGDHEMMAFAHTAFRVGRSGCVALPGRSH
jgi:HAD superfamily hydrolase (TIGR01490 family)